MYYKDFRLYGKNTKCPICGAILEKDDIELVRRGSHNEWWICPCCSVSRYVEIRNYNCSVSQFFNDGVLLRFN